jgi:hypothetical protein
MSMSGILTLLEGQSTWPGGGASPISTLGRAGAAATIGRRASNHFILMVILGVGSIVQSKVNWRADDDHFHRIFHRVIYQMFGQPARLPDRRYDCTAQAID